MINGMDTQDPMERVSETIQKLDHIDFISLIGDLCAIRGWQPSLEVGNEQSAGDIVAVRRLPVPEAIAIACYDEDLTESMLRDCWETHKGSEQSELTVVVRGEPDEDAYSYAEEVQIGMLDTTDITSELFGLSAIDLLAEYHEGFELDPSSSAGSDEDQERSTDSSRPQSTDNEQIAYSPEHTTQNDSLIMELRGFQYHSTDGERKGVFFDVGLKCKSGTQEIRPSSFVLYGAGGGISGAESDDSDVVKKMSGIVEPEWKTGEVEISTSESVNYLVYVPNQGKQMSGLGFEDLSVPLFQEEIARGLPAQLSSVLDDLFGLE
jgi:hypothetical protein